MRISVPTETVAHERRVALVPESVGRLVKAGVDVVVQQGAGARAYFPDRAYADAGATLAGYKAVLVAAGALGKFLPMLTTAAGSIPPAKAFIIGAGVAGLQAIATARRLGAVVSAFDVRPAAREQVESLGATFLAIELPDEDTETAGGYAKELSAEAHRREVELVGEHVAASDAVITTALIPGRPAPVLVTAAMVASMR